MRGSPLLRAALVFIALLALAPIVASITRKTAPAAGMVEPPEITTPDVAAAKIEGAWTFTTPPQRVAVKHLGAEVWGKVSPGAQVEFSITIPWPAEGVELHVAIEWPPGTETAAARLRLTAPDGAEHDRTVWGGASADEVLVFP